MTNLPWIDELLLQLSIFEHFISLYGEALFKAFATRYLSVGFCRRKKLAQAYQTYQEEVR